MSRKSTSNDLPRLLPFTTRYYSPETQSAGHSKTLVNACSAAVKRILSGEYTVAEIYIKDKLLVGIVWQGNELVLQFTTKAALETINKGMPTKHRKEIMA